MGVCTATFQGELIRQGTAGGFDHGGFEVETPLRSFEAEPALVEPS